MNTSSFDQTLIEQNAHWDGAPYRHQFTREHEAEAINDLKLDEIQVITGIRRCGKSTLLQTLINHLMNQESAKALLYINFDDPNYTDVCNDAAGLYDVVTSAEKLTGEKVTTLLLDEVQNVEAWEQYVKSMYDSKRFTKIIVTGSNADLLNSDYASLLTGRYIETHIYPLSFSELLMNAGITNRLELVQQKPQVLKLFESLLQFGGFPRIVQVDDEKQKRKLLKSYYETILLKDCVQNHSVRDTKTLKNLAHYLLSNNATRYSYNSLSKALGSNENTIKKFVDIFANAYFIQELKHYSYSLKAQNRLEKKTYCIDNGFLTATTFRFSDNLGKLLENLVYTQLQITRDAEVFFFNDSQECDFIVHSGKISKAIQVCYELNQANRKREMNGIKFAMEKLSIAKGVIITYDQEEQISEELSVVPFWKYFSGLD